MKRFYGFVLLSILFTVSGYAQDKVKIGGLMYGDAFYNIDNADSSKKDINGFQFRRIYFTSDFILADKFDARFRLEADQSANSNTAGGKIGVMVKDAWLKWKDIFSGSDMLFGVSPTPAYDISEAAWNYRSLEKTIMDYNGIVPSRDLGVDLKGKILSDGAVGYWVKIANNSGNAAETDKFKRYYGLLQFKPFEGLMATVYGDFASAKDKLDSFDKTLKSNSATVGALFINYKMHDDLSVGFEAFTRTISNNYAASATVALANQNSFGFSIWAWGTLSETFRLVVRYDSYDPNTDKDNDGTGLLIAGVDCRPAKNVSIIPNIEMNTFQAKNWAGNTQKNMVGRVTFAYTF